MNALRTFLFSSGLLVLFVLAAAIQPANAQTARGKQAHHQAIPAGKTCADCHKMTDTQWKGSPHAAADVQCTACHGEIKAQSVTATPKLSACEACHGEQVAQLKSDPWLKGKTCTTCHQPHGFTVHKKAAATAK